MSSGMNTEQAVERLREVLRFVRVVDTNTNEFSYCHDLVQLQSGRDLNYTTTVWLDGEAAEALKAVLDSGS
jgi:hypothetical protein